MTRDRSLDEFATDEAGRAGDPDGGASGEGDDGASGGRDDGREEDAGEDNNALAATYRWSAEPGACDACGTRVSARWRDDAGFVCADCKAW